MSVVRDQAHIRADLLYALGHFQTRLGAIASEEHVPCAEALTRRGREHMDEADALSGEEPTEEGERGPPVLSRARH